MYVDTCIYAYEFKMQSLKRKKWLIALLSSLTAVCSFSVGFASWIIPATGDSASVNGTLGADNLVVPVIPAEYKHVITIDEDSLTTFEFSAGHGFVKNGVYANNIDLGGTCTFYYEDGQKCFNSFKNSDTKSFTLEIQLSSSLTGGLYQNNFVSDYALLSSDNFVDVETNPTDDTIISTSSDLVCSDNESDFEFTFLINLKWTGSLSNFPDLTDSAITVTLIPMEKA